MMSFLEKVYSYNGYPIISSQAFARIFYLSKFQVLSLIKNKILYAFKWKKVWWIFIPKKPISKKSFHPNSPTEATNFEKKSNPNLEVVETPSGEKIKLDWEKEVEKLPEDVASRYEKHDFNFLTQHGKLHVVVPNVKVSLSTLTPKASSQIIPLSLQTFRSTKEYKYGSTIIYDPNKMSTFDPGDGGSLKATQIPAAFFEVCRLLDAAEQNRNGANPGLTPRRNLATTISFDTGTISVAATLPITTSIHTDGSIDVSTQDYLSSTYSTFTHGGGDLVSTTVMGAFLELASKLAAEEKLVQPADSQPNNVQISFDLEAGAATVSANLPFTTAAATNGDVTIHAIDYL